MLKSTVVLLKRDQVRCVTVKNEFFCLRDEDGSVRRSDINSSRPPPFAQDKEEVGTSRRRDGQCGDSGAKQLAKRKRGLSYCFGSVWEWSDRTAKAEASG